MNESELLSLPYALLKQNKHHNAPVWTNRYRPSFVSRTASENRRKALVDYLATSGGSRINRDNLPNAVKHEHENLVVQKQFRGRAYLSREPTLASEYSAFSTHLPTSSSAVFVTQQPNCSTRNAVNLDPNSKYPFLASPRPVSPSSNTLTCSVSSTVNSPTFKNGQPIQSSSKTPVCANEQTFKPWKREYWNNEASTQGKILYFQVSRSAPLAPRPRNIPSSEGRRTNKKTLKKTTAQENAVNELKPEVKSEEKVEEKVEKREDQMPKAAEEPVADDNLANVGKETQFKAVLESSDGSFPLSYVDIRPLSGADRVQEKGETVKTQEEQDREVTEDGDEMSASEEIAKQIIEESVTFAVSIKERDEPDENQEGEGSKNDDEEAKEVRTGKEQDKEKEEEEETTAGVEEQSEVVEKSEEQADDGTSDQVPTIEEEGERADEGEGEELH